MKLFEARVAVVVCNPYTYIVEAESKEDALKKAINGETIKEEKWPGGSYGEVISRTVDPTSIKERKE